MNFEDMKNIDIKNVNPDDLVDIKDIKVDPNLSKQERIIEYIRQIKNPYCYKCGDIIVKVSFSDTAETIESCLEKYFRVWTSK